MSEEVYIPITPATRIPFPCWLWDNKDKFWFKASECWQGCTERHNITHYCTSATEPTGRPGEETPLILSVGDIIDCASKLYSVTAICLGALNQSSVVELIPLDESRAPYHTKSTNALVPMSMLALLYKNKLLHHEPK